MRKQLLAQYLKCRIDEIQESNYDDDYVFTYGDSDYLVITGEEADNETIKQIPYYLYQMNLSFLKLHLKIDISTSVLQQFLYEMCDSCRLIFWELIIDKELFFKDAIQTYGRGYFLAWFDKREIEICTPDSIPYYIYRVSGPVF